MTPALKVHRAGTHRAISPDETVRRALRLAPVMGITRVANVTGLDDVGVPVVTVSRPNSRSLAVTQGKGISLDAAKASALMESIEAYHAETITLPLRYCSLEELCYTNRVVEVGRLPRVATSSFHANMRILWCDGRDLMSDETVFVPYELVHSDCTWPQPPGSGCFAGSSNGLASGNHYLEAVSHGICEVVERDSTTLWHLRRPADQQARSIDLSTVDDDDCTQVIARFERAGLRTIVWETTSDLEIASFLCVIFPAVDDPSRPLPPAAGAGCHPSRAIALLRALTEAAQTRVVLIAGSRDDIGRDVYGPHRYAASVENLRHEPAGRRSFLDSPTWDADTLDADVEWELDRLRAGGIKRVVAIDLTKDFFKLPVVRVVIPGLEGVHEQPGFTPGRRALALATARG
ncbi:MAG TPA: YcaO-like family protein [Candidatus Dormibacteraeota bacterium]